MWRRGGGGGGGGGEYHLFQENVFLRWLNTALAVCKYMSFANHGKRKVAAHKLKLEKYTDERF